MSDPDDVDVQVPAGGDATGGGDPGNPDDMGADDGLTVDEGAGRHEVHDEGEHDEHAG